MLLKKTKQFIRDKQLLDQGDRILVGVSGGVDSLALLDVLIKLSTEENWSLFAAHLDHQFRGQESHEDAMYVQQFCLERNIPCKIGKVDVPLLIQQSHMNPQEAARVARYQFFREIAKEWRTNKLALAHHANDQAETVLMRILRGTGVDGLGGIPKRRKEAHFEIVRPFLSVLKHELEEYCSTNNIIPRLDSSNLKKKYHRNFIRLEVIPWLEQAVNPALQTSLSQLSEIAQAESDLLDQMCEEILPKIIKTKQEAKIVMKGKLFMDCHLALQRRLIKLIFSYLVGRYVNIAFIHIDHLCRWIHKGRNSTEVELPHGIRVTKEYDDIIFSVDSASEVKINPYSYIIEVPGRTYIEEIDAWISVQISDQRVPPETEGEAYAVFDCEQLMGQLVIRNRKAGDRMSLLGMRGSKKVKDIFIDQKIPPRIRDITPILADDQGILWIPGVKRSNRALITTHTKHTLTIHLEKTEDY